MYINIAFANVYVHTSPLWDKSLKGPFALLLGPLSTTAQVQSIDSHLVKKPLSSKRPLCSCPVCKNGVSISAITWYFSSLESSAVFAIGQIFYLTAGLSPQSCVKMDHLGIIQRFIDHILTSKILPRVLLQGRNNKQSRDQPWLAYNSHIFFLCNFWPLLN